MRTIGIHALFFLSGAAGLVYQVVWVRQFGTLFGNTVYSAATVSAVFLCGLGLGSYAAGLYTDRRHRADLSGPLRAYGLAELGIAVWALGLAYGMPLLEQVSAALSTYTRGPEGWNELTLATHASRYGMAALLVAPATFLMGATLTLLIRHLVARDLGLAGWRVGTLFGINTAGAALGAFLTDFALVPELGLLATQWIAVALNAFAGIGALVLARRREGAPDVAGAAPEASAARAPASAGPAPPVASIGAALFLTGFTAIGMEILWLRYLITLIGAYRAVFSLLLTVILLGIFAGSLLGGYLERRTGRPARLFVTCQALFALAAVLQLAFFDPAGTSRSGIGYYETYRQASSLGRVWLETWFDLQPILLLVAIPALLMGFSFPLANALVQRAEGQVGRRAGLLYLSNTFGNVAGSLTTGFVLLPWIGMQHSVTVLIAVLIVAIGVLGRGLGGGRSGGAHLGLGEVAASAAGVAIALVVWVGLVPPGHMLRPALPASSEEPSTLLALSEGINESIAVVDVPGVARRLRTNGHNMSSTSARARRYMGLFVHLPLLQADDPKQVLVICVGVGNTLHAATLHESVRRVEGVDLSRHVVEHVRYFDGYNGEVMKSPKLAIFINDGRQHLRMQPEDRYDLITLEPPPINYAGVSALYSREFYELARSRLAPGGFMSQWLPAYQVDDRTTLAMIRAFLDVFPDAALFSGFKREFILLGRKDAPLRFDPPRVRARLEAEPALREELRELEVDSLTDLAGTFVADSDALEEATRGVEALTDEHPVLEYSARSKLFEGLADVQLPPGIFDVWGIDSWCPSCLERPALLPHLRGTLMALDACYRSGAFLRVASHESREPHPLHGGSGGAVLPRTAEVEEALEASPYLRRMFRAKLLPDEGSARRYQPCVVSSPGANGDSRESGASAPPGGAPGFSSLGPSTSISSSLRWR